MKVFSVKSGFKAVVCAGVAACVLIACGGGGGGGGTPANVPPTFTSAATATLAENSQGAFYTATANDPDSAASPTLTLSSTGDSQYFTLDSQTGVLSPNGVLNFEFPADTDGDNVYDVELSARNSDGGTGTLIVAVTVTDVNETMAFGLNPALSPSENFDLSDWKVQLPVNDDGEFTTTGRNDRSDQIEDYDLDDNCSDPNYSNGFLLLSDAADYSGCENRFFFTGPDGGMVLRSPPIGATTSYNATSDTNPANRSYPRSELREMLRAGNRSISTNGSGNRPNGNNWVFSSAPQSAQDDAGGVEGNLKVTLSVDDVTTTGDSNQVGRFIMGQIHAADDEPIRLYYRKLPGNSHGSIYMAHERREDATGTVTGDDVCGDGNTATYDAGDDVWCEIIGSRDDNAPNPAGGIQLGEIFSYEIDVVGNDMTVTIEKGGVVIGTQNVDMSRSNYDVDDDYMYFKAGVYQQNRSGNADDYAQVTIYALDNSH